MIRVRLVVLLVATPLSALLVLSASSARAGTLTGTVAVDGKPVTAAVVSAIPFEEPLGKARRQARGETEPKVLASATTGPGGAFALTIPAVAGKETLFRVRAAAKGGVVAQLPGVYDTSESEDLGEVTLRKAAAMAGRVTGPGGKPVAGARVTLTAVGRFDASSGLVPVPEVATTGADGTFRFEGAASERNELLVEARGLAAAGVTDAKGGVRSRAITLVAGTALAGRVKTRDGTPAAGVLVRYETEGVESRWVETGTDGAFLLEDLPARRGNVVADAGEDGFAEAVSIVPAPGRAPLALALGPPTVLEGRTLDIATMKAVPRVKLTVVSDSGRRIGRSGADGRYRLTGFRPGEVKVFADEPRHVRWTRARVALEKGATKTLDVPLVRGASLSGRVVDEDGRPVPDAKIRISSGAESPFASARRAMEGDPGAKARSRLDGTFSASRLPPGENQRLTAQHPDYEKGTLGGISLVAGGARSGAVLTLRRGLVLTGTVKDPEGNPISGAELTLSQSRTVGSSRGGRMTRVIFGGASEISAARSGADGRFELKGIPAGDWAFTATAAGRATEVVDPLTLARDTRPDPVDVVLVPGAAIAGFVLRKTGGGAEGYLVLPRPAGKPPTGGFGSGLTPTGPDGAFFLDGLKAGEAYDLQLLGGAMGGPGPVKRGIAAPAADVEWIVEGAGRIEGVAVDGKSGQPLSSFEVSFQPDRSGFGGRGGMQIGGRGGGRGSSGMGEPLLVEAADGRFALENVPAGKWQVLVTAKGYQTGRAGSVVVEEATTTDGVEVRVLPGSLLKGRVTDARSGRGVPEARVGVATEAGASTSTGGGSSSALVTDVDGRFEVEGLAPGKLKVSVDHADYTERTESVELKEGGGSVEIALSRGSSLGGVVLSETRQPMPGAEVSLAGANAPGRGFGGGESAATDASGRFHFDHLSPGRYTLQANVPAQTTEPVDAILVAGESKEDVTLVLAGGARIRGVVSGLSDTLRVAVSVSASGPRDYWASTRTGADGRFELAGAPAGTVSLRAMAGDFVSGTTRSASGSVTIAEGQKEAEAEIVFEGNGALSGHITRGGAPVADVRVVLAGTRGASSASGRTDESGSYRIEGLTPGDYNVTVQAIGAGGGRGVSKAVRVDGEAALDVDLPMARLFGIVVEGATKQPLSDVRVTANPESGTPGRPGSSTSDSSGRFFVDDLEPGAYALTLRRSGYQEATDTVSATEDGGDAGTIEMTRGDGLELRVRDGIYQIPLRSASVRVKDAAGTTVTSTWLSLDGDGRGEISSLRPGRYSLVVGSSGYAVQVLDGIVVPGAPLPLALTPGGSVEIHPGEASRAKGVATLWNALGQPHPYRPWGAEGRVPLPAAGPEVLENLAPGSYTLAVEGVAPKGFTVTEGGRAVVELP